VTNGRVSTIRAAIDAAGVETTLLLASSSLHAGR
jgi:hypothetical protein